MVKLTFVQYHVLHDTWRLNKTNSHQEKIEDNYKPLKQELVMKYVKEDMIMKMVYMEQLNEMESIRLNKSNEYEPYFYVYSEGFVSEIGVKLTGKEEGGELVEEKVGVKYVRKGDLFNNIRVKVPFAVCGVHCN